jgi:hypothetical protein
MRGTALLEGRRNLFVVERTEMVVEGDYDAISGTGERQNEPG